MRAIVCAAWGGPERLALADVAEPVPGPGDALIDVHACSVNFADLLMIDGAYQTRPALPFVPGLEAAGRIASAPPGSGLAAGDRVVAFLWHGGYAERAAAAAAETFLLPPGLAFDEAAALLSAHTSADLALVRGQLAPAQALLVLGAGGVGLAAMQIGKALGARVIAVVSGPARAALARQAGADHAICHAGAPDWKAQVLEAAGPAGVDVCLDPVGGPLFDGALSTLGWGGRYVLVGFAAGQVPQIPAHRLLVKHRAALGCSLRYFRRFDPPALQRSVARVLAWRQQGVIAPVIGARLPLDQAPAGLRALAERRAAGKIVVCVRDPEGQRGSSS